MRADIRLTLIVKHAFNLTGCKIYRLWLDMWEIRKKTKKKNKPSTNLNILLYQTNLDYRRNHQSVQVKLEQNSPDWIHVKYTITIQKQNKHYMVHKYTRGKNKSLHRNVLMSLIVHCGHSGHCWQLWNKLLVLWLINLLTWHQYRVAVVFCYSFFLSVSQV